jgi:hypothetical protein
MSFQFGIEDFFILARKSKDCAEATIEVRRNKPAPAKAGEG